MAKAPKTPKSTDEADAVTDAKVAIKSKTFVLFVEASYEDAFGARSETFRLDNVDPAITDEAIEAEIRARYA